MKWCNGNNLGMTPNNQSFVKYIQLISALPLKWINRKRIAQIYRVYGKNVISIELLVQSNKTAYTF